MALCRIRLGSGESPSIAQVDADLRVTDVGRVGSALTITAGALATFQLVCSTAEQAELLADNIREVVRS